MTAFIRFPWATSGDKETVPATTQVDGAVSLQEGYGEDYSRDLRSDPAARSVERSKFNGFMNLLSSAIRFLQINGGYPEFITTADNGGSAFAYGNGVRVRYDAGSGMQTYQSRKDNNTSLPTVTADWFLVDATTGVPAGQITDSSIAANAAINASKIANGTVSNTEFQYLDGVTSGLQAQLDGKQPNGNYITALTGDVTAAGPGSAAATIANNAVTTAKILDANVTTAKIADANVTTVKIADSNVTAAKLASNAVTTAKILDANVTNVKIAAGVDAAKIANGSVSNTEFQYLDGVSSNIQTQLNGKQATGNYMTALTGDVTAAGPGSSAATIANNAVTTSKINNGAVTTAKMDTTGVGAGSYYNANVQVDAAGRIVAASNGANPFGLLEGFETWSGGLPNTLPWTSPNTANISQSALHVTQGTSSLAFSGTAEINVTGQNLSQYGELNLDVFVGTAPAGSRVRLTCGANSVETTVATTGTYKLRCPIPAGATNIKIESISGSIAWVDNLQYVVLVSASGVTFSPPVGMTSTNVQDAVTEIFSKGLPTGMPVPWPVNSVPTGFLKMNGAAVSRTTYAALFAVLGTTWGAGDGSTTFNLPDWRGIFVRGFDDGRNVDTGRTFAAQQADAFQQWTASFETRWPNVSQTPTGIATSAASAQSAANAGTGSRITLDPSLTARTAAETRPINNTALWVIKY